MTAPADTATELLLDLAVTFARASAVSYGAAVGELPVRVPPEEATAMFLNGAAMHAAIMIGRAETVALLRHLIDALAEPGPATLIDALAAQAAA